MTFKWETTHTTTARLFTHTESPSDVSAATAADVIAAIEANEELKGAIAEKMDDEWFRSLEKSRDEWKSRAQTLEANYTADTGALSGVLDDWKARAEQAESRLREAEQAERETPEPWVEIVGRWMRAPATPKIDHYHGGDPVDLSKGVSTTDVLLWALEMRAKDIRQADQIRMGHVLRRLGFSRKPNPVRREGERVRLYFPPAPPQPGPGTLPPPWPPRG